MFLFLICFNFLRDFFFIFWMLVFSLLFFFLSLLFFRIFVFKLDIILFSLFFFFLMFEIRDCSLFRFFLLVDTRDCKLRSLWFLFVIIFCKVFNLFRIWSSFSSFFVELFCNFFWREVIWFLVSRSFCFSWSFFLLVVWSCEGFFWLVVGDFLIFWFLFRFLRCFCKMDISVFVFCRVCVVVRYFFVWVFSILFVYKRIVIRLWFKLI